MSELSDKLATLDIKLTSTHLGLREDIDWLHDEFECVITFNDKTMTVVPPYRMGVGNRKLSNILPRVKKGYTTHGRVQYVASNGDVIYTDKEACQKNWLRLTYPDLADVLYSLLVDSNAGEMPFITWAGDYGYDADSRSALDAYLKCQQIYIDLIRLFGGGA